ncbi:hypothetical protein HJFPF1_11663 [Paramyrothecium foliicola]|nr:hypothetical protein HJFPF1_11663 [Paramyrothecium foliicola]
MSDNNMKPTSGSPLDTNIAVPEKAALTNVFASPVDTLGRSSADSSPRSLKSDNPFDTDIEAMATTDSLQYCVTKNTSNMAKTKSECQVWPGKDHWQRRDKAAKAKRSCTFMAGLSPRNKIIVKVLIIVLIVGVGVGVGFGVSKPLGAPIWGDDDHH